MVTFLSDSFFFLFFLSTHSQHFYGKENKCSAPNRGDNSWPFQLGCVLVLPKNKKKSQPAVRTGWENEKRLVPCDIIISGEVD
jgi:hypothetical protein